MTQAEAIIRAEISNRPGPENAIKGRDLARLAGITTRDLQTFAVKLRKDGFPIFSTVHPPFGYYYGKTPEDFDHYLNQLKARRGGISETIDDVKAMYPRVKKDCPLFDETD